MTPYMQKTIVCFISHFFTVMCSETVFITTVIRDKLLHLSVLKAYLTELLGRENYNNLSNSCFERDNNNKYIELWEIVDCILNIRICFKLTIHNALARYQYNDTIANTSRRDEQKYHSLKYCVESSGNFINSVVLILSFITQCMFT